MPDTPTSPIRFVSTRGQAPAASLEDALLGGLAPDGGLFVPTHIPSVPSADWQTPTSFSELASRLLSPWTAPDVSPDALAAIVHDALDFPVPLVPLKGPGWESVYVLELFHGPTLSFKDFGARTMARLMGHFMRRRREHLTILVATSGDTGSAVADGFAGQEDISVVLLYPKGRVSPTQERQLITARPGVTALAVDGAFDDCQRLVKAAFQDDALAHLLLSSANSINIGRLLPQMLYYFWAARRLGGDEVVFCVPSGNLGNLTGGVLAALGGLPVRRFVAAHNANDFFPRFLSGAAEDFAASVPTRSNAMDVGAPSNFERLRRLLSNEDLRRRIWGTSVSDEETLQSMRRVHETTGHVADPHTAVGLEAARRYREHTGDDTPIIVLSTAHPAKFPETVHDALGFGPEPPERLAVLWEQETRATPISASLVALRRVLFELRDGETGRRGDGETGSGCD